MLVRKPFARWGLGSHKPDFTNLLAKSDKEKQMALDLERFKALLALVDYGCDFRNGKCIDSRRKKIHRRWADPEKPGMCCCRGCASNSAYMDYHPRLPEAITFLTETYDSETGFWRKGKGCIIPHKWRSQTCLGHYCVSAKNSEHLVPLQYIHSTLRRLAGEKW